MSLDPEDDTTDNGSTNMSKGDLQSAWQKWTSNPANNAMLLQTGIALMQPRSPGQSGIGQFANAIGSGGEAAGRVVAAQNAEDEAARRAEDTTSQIESRKSASETARINAEAYGRQVDNLGGGKGLTATLRAQNAFRTWLAKPEDTTGTLQDPIVATISRQFPNIKSKADILSNPQASAAAFKLFQAQLAPVEGADEEGTSTAVPSTPSIPTPPPGTPRIIYDPNNKPYIWDGIKGHAPVPK